MSNERIEVFFYVKEEMEPLCFEITPDTELSDTIKIYQKVMKYGLTFIYNGHVIKEGDTPRKLGMETGAEVWVFWELKKNMKITLTPGVTLLSSDDNTEENNNDNNNQ